MDCKKYNKIPAAPQDGLRRLNEDHAISNTTCPTMTAVTVNPVRPNPEDSIRSTWRRQDRSTWSIYHWIFEWGDFHHVYLDRKVPVFAKTDKIPYIPDWYLHRFIIFHTALSMIAHELFTYFTGMNFHPVVAYIYYQTAGRLFLSTEMRVLRELGHTYGFLDGDKHERDGVPDVGVKKALISILMAGFGRPLMTVLLTYNANETPSSINWKSLPIQLMLYGIILDFWFYWYHRLMHEIGGLWKYHRTHHLTKHPNPLLTIYADQEQEFFDIWGIPLMTAFSLKIMGLPLGFYEWIICQNYVVFAEIAGHSGIRLHAAPPNLITWLMRWFDMELVIEDHDMHHRKGWKNSFNYGKQTRIWDRVFGTTAPRIESADANVDYNHPVAFPLYVGKSRA